MGKQGENFIGDNGVFMIFYCQRAKMREEEGRKNVIKNAY